MCDKGKYAESLTYLDKATSLYPKDASVLIERGNAYYFLKQYDKALEDYSNAITVNPNYLDAYLGRANAYEELKDNQKPSKN